MRNCLLLLLLVSLPLTAAAQDVSEVLDTVKSTYESVDALTADFTQTMSSEFMTGPQTTSGVLTLMGDNYRVETGSQTIVTDGVVTWVFNSEENQLIINDYEQDETTFSMSEFFSSFDENHDVRNLRSESLDGEAHHVLDLTPLDEGSFFTDITVWVRKSDSIITKLRIVDANETTMSFMLDSIVINPEVAPGTFSFSPQADTDVVDLRS